MADFQLNPSEVRFVNDGGEWSFKVIIGGDVVYKSKISNIDELQRHALLISGLESEHDVRLREAIAEITKNVNKSNSAI